MAKSFQVELTDQADEDLNSILHYLLDNYGKASALNAMQGIKECLVQIGNRPEAYGIWEPGIGRLNFECRYKIANKRHRVLYRLRKAKGVVQVSRITHKTMPSENLLKSLEEE